MCSKKGVRHKVVAVTHQPVGHQLGVEAVHRLGTHRQKRMSIPAVNKDRFAPVASRSNVVNRSGGFDSQWVGQGKMQVLTLSTQVDTRRQQRSVRACRFAK